MTDALDIGVFGARAIPSTYSGYETFLTALLPALAARGHRVTMYCRPGTIDEETPFEGVERRITWATSTVSTSTLSHGLVTAVASRRAGHDVALVVNVANTPFTYFQRLSGQPVVVNTDGQEWLRGKWGPLGRRVFHASARIARRSATALVSDCAAMADIYRDEFRAESTVIPYCFPASDWSPGDSVLTAHGLTSRDYVVVGGRHNPENNIDRVTESYVAGDLPHPLLVLGTANYDSPVTRRVAELAERDDRVRMLGHVDDRHDFFDLLHHSAVYVHGHSVGGMNPSLVEAMRSGVDIAALETPFNRETLGDAGNYFTLDGADTLVSTIASMLAEGSAARRAAASARVDEQFPVDDVVDAYEALLVAASSSGRARQVTVPTRWR